MLTAGDSLAVVEDRRTERDEEALDKAARKAIKGADKANAAALREALKGAEKQSS